MKKENVIKVIQACVLLVIGVLFCVSKAMGENVLSIILGASLIAAGSVLVVLSAVKDKSVLNGLALGGLLALSLGIFFIVANTIAYVLTIVPYILIVFGGGLLVDSFLGYFARKEKVLAIIIIKIVVAVALIVFGILFLTVNGFGDWIALLVGIALILIAIVDIALEFIKANNSNQ